MFRKDFKAFQLFHTKTEDIEQLKTFSAEDFELASAAEKENMVEKRKSVSYWKDAFRRFKKNHVSVVAFFLFLLICIFAFVGPYLIPYSYEEQYRNSMKLGPFENSEAEIMAEEILQDCDAIYATSLQPGSLTGLKKGLYTFKDGSDWYVFRLKKNLSDSVIVFDKDFDYPIYFIKEKDYMAGEYELNAVAYEVHSEQPEEITVLEFDRSVFPHVFGTDSAGRDIMSRSMYGARVSILIGIIASLIVLVIGSIYGSVAGLVGGKVDFVMMRIVEIIYSVPDVLIVLLLQVVLQEPLQNWFDTSEVAFVKSLGTLGTGIISIFITFALLYWVGMSRIVRGQVLMLKEQEFVTAANVLGAKNGRIIKRHLLPNCVGQLVIATCLQIPSAIFLESYLSFLGLGISAPMSSLGSLCSDAIETITLYPYRLIFPAVILSLLVLSLNLVGDGLRDALDPRLKK